MFKWIPRLLLCLLALSLASWPARAEVNQTNAQETNANLNHVASDDDIEAATTSGMTAIMNLAALNIPGAIKFGYKGYGEYKNSRKLDKLEAHNQRLQVSMGSLGSPVLKGGTGYDGQGKIDGKSGISGKPEGFARIKPDFLYRGEAAKVAEEFEKKSGMKREEFLQHLAAAQTAKLNYNDPELLSKILARAEIFKSRIPNKEFREGLDRAMMLVPGESTRAALLDKARAFFLSDNNEPPPNSLADLTSGTANAPVAAAHKAAAPVPAQEAQASVAITQVERKPAAALPAYKKGEVGLYIGMDQAADPAAINEFLQAGRLDSESESLFKRVSSRYRALTPAISPGYPKSGG